MKASSNHRNRLILLTALTAMVVGCDKNEEIRSYSAPKESPAQITQTASPHEHATDPAANVQWTLPAGWKLVPEQKPMRVATLEVATDAGRLEIAVTSFPGDVGGLANNVNRWRGQIGLEPVDDAQAAALVKPLSESGPNAKRMVVDITGTAGGGAPSMMPGAPGAAGGAKSPARMIGVIIDDGAGSTWFVKALGTPEQLTAQRDAILEFARSIRFAPADPHAPKVADGAPAAMPPAAVPPMMAPNTVPAPELGAAGMPKWTAPKSWTAQEASSPLLAVYSVPDSAGSAVSGKVTVSFLVGDGGGALPNINRWRGQIGLAPVERLDQQPTVLIEVGGRQGVLLDLAGPKSDATPAKGMLVAMIVDNGRTWFFKMTGPTTLLSERKAEFSTFVSSAKLP